MKWYPAPGKLNLFLHVLGKRETGEHAGYHELQTVFRLIDRADRVGIALREDGEVCFSGVYGQDNLCFRAAHLLKELTETAQGADISLEKILPVGGGMKPTMYVANIGETGSAPLDLRVGFFLLLCRRRNACRRRPEGSFRAKCRRPAPFQ